MYLVNVNYFVIILIFKILTHKTAQKSLYIILYIITDLKFYLETF